ncbi:PRMT5-domain-containing protein [Cristinia sonorae]|uniref:PRMT5-domain-containing protein n=1 Tax=Cristinia sonorae TaxID=1940300 RepID=A0A8K0UMK7_9AGAR|nr:PRMT5-domain-containing protein [Cristinia sonorae]
MSTLIAHVTLADLVKTALTLATPNPTSPIPGSPTENETPVLRSISEARAKGYECIGLPLTNDSWRTRWQDMCVLPPGEKPDRHSLEAKAEQWRVRPCFTRDEVNVTKLEEAEGVIAFVSDWLELDAYDDWVRHDSETALLQELAYASYLGIRTAILPSPRHRAHVGSYARAVNAALKATPYMQLSVRIPIYDPSMVQLIPPGTEEDPSKEVGPDTIPSVATWEMWDVIRNVCGYNPMLTLTLDLTPPLPSQLQVLDQWIAEPTRFIFLPASTFHSNVKGYPVLPKGTQSFIRDLMKIQPSVILSGINLGRHANGGEVAYAQYVRHLEKTSPAVKAARTAGTVENFAQGYQDYLQAPLQPLMDNLQSMTYNTFEQDPVKYRNYEEAIYRAVMEWPRPGTLVICVAGAGRGPLVARAISAVGRTKREAIFYAVEKNPNAFVTLQERSRNEWGDKVTLLFGDMRTLEVPEKVDILVSELLGSFGDNELSPECLDGAMRFLKPDGISIPASYTAHIAPLSSSKLFNEARAAKDDAAKETPYVVMLSSINIMSDGGGGLSGRCGPRVQECWEFEHPRRDPVLNAQGLPMTNSHNTRSAKLIFHIPHAGVLHGLAGYFEAVLYGTVGLSIHPERMDKISKDMLSWFPLFIPFKEPLYLPSNCELHVSLWRLTNERQVWYEWYAEAFLALPGSSMVLEKSTPKTDSPSDSAELLSPSKSIVSSSSASSAIVDADESTAVSPTFSESVIMYEEPNLSRIGLVKIGQTSLHNPGGRSSWIGL